DIAPAFFLWMTAACAGLTASKSLSFCFRERLRAFGIGFHLGARPHCSSIHNHGAVYPAQVRLR
ncbi:hypothetical protein K8353_45760, partial [Burkholderia contaminans]|nr:hypothetical protein [Burkholderia contaminans]